MFALAYLSTASHPPSQAELEGLLADARTFNARNSLSGALLLHDLTFFQFLEGPEVAVRAAFERIQSAKLHKDIVLLMLEETPRRFFGDWHMGFADAPASVQLQLAQAQWKASADNERTAHEEVPPGVALLLDFWRGARRRLH